MQAEAEAAEMRMKGYTYQQETARQVGLEAMKNGLVGTGVGAGSVVRYCRTWGFPWSHGKCYEYDKGSYGAYECKRYADE